MAFRRLFLIFCCLCCTVAWAATVSVAPETRQLSLREQAFYLAEDEARLGPEQALAAVDAFHSHAERALAPGAAMRWVRFALRNDGAEAGEWWLDLGVPDIEVLEAWRTDPKLGLAPLLALGPEAAYGARPVPERRLVLPMQLAAGEEFEVLLRYRTHADTPLSLTLHAPDDFRRDLATDNLINGILIGVLLALLSFALLQHLAGGERAFAAYAAMAALMIAFLAQFEGYNFAWLWPSHGLWNQVAPILLLAGIQVAQSLFALALFDMRQTCPALARLYRLYLLCLPLSLLAYFGAGWVVPGLLLALSYIALVIAAGIIYRRRGSSVATPFLIGAAGNALFSNVLFALSMFGVGLPVQPFVYPKIGYVCEALCFAIALVRQLQYLRRRVEDGLRRHLAEAEALARAEGEKLQALQSAQESRLALASTSHDLSQPLASIRLALTVLKQQTGDAATTAHIDRSLDYTESLLRDLIESARRQHGVPTTLLKLDDVLFAAWQRHQAAARSKGLSLHCRPNGYRLEASALILDRLLDNLLGNAIRYTERGRILLGVRYREAGLEIQVRDSGPGFDERQRRRLLAPFEQGESGGAGYGLGLHIVHTLCAEAGYRLTIHSVPGAGTTFGILIPRLP